MYINSLDVISIELKNSLTSEGEDERLKEFWRSCIKRVLYDDNEEVVGGINVEIMLDTEDDKRKIVHYSGLENVTNTFHMAMRKTLLQQQFIRREAVQEISLLLTCHLNDDEDEIEYSHSIPGKLK